MVDTKHTDSSNYLLIGKNKKPETFVEVDKIPKTKEIILEILMNDKKFWDEAKQRQQGVEKSILLSKVSAKISINSNVFFISLDELDAEQKVIFEVIDSKVRYSILSLNKSNS